MTAHAITYLLSSSSSLEGLRPDIGVMVGPRVTGIRPLEEGRQFAVDCDAFSEVVSYDDQVYFAHLERLRPYHAQCLFAVVPDHYRNGDATRESYEASVRILAEFFPFPLAYVLQDGCEQHGDFPHCDAVFLGGSDPWREACGAGLLLKARAEGLYTHCGRVNSQRRLDALAALDVDSADGTYMRFAGLDRAKRDIGQWLDHAQAPRVFSADSLRPAFLSVERALSLRQSRSGRHKTTYGEPTSDQPDLFTGASSGQPEPVQEDPAPSGSRAARAQTPGTRLGGYRHLDLNAHADFLNDVEFEAAPRKSRAARRPAPPAPSLLPA